MNWPADDANGRWAAGSGQVADALDKAEAVTKNWLCNYFGSDQRPDSRRLRPKQSRPFDWTCDADRSGAR